MNLGEEDKAVIDVCEKCFKVAEVKRFWIPSKLVYRWLCRKCRRAYIEQL